MAKRKSGSKSAAVLVGDVCLYGAHHCGFSFIARAASAPADLICRERPGTFGTLTEAIWSAVEALRSRGVEGTVRIFGPGGASIVDVDTTAHVPAAGSLPWRRPSETVAEAVGR